MTLILSNDDVEGLLTVGECIDVLEEAYGLDKENRDPCRTALRAWQSVRLTVYVFEDTVSGIKPLLKIADRLNALGYAITVKPMGIARQKSKRAALAPLCNQLFDNIERKIQPTEAGPQCCEGFFVLPIQICFHFLLASWFARSDERF